MPTSITIAPSRIQSPGIMRGLPTPTTRISAERTKLSRSRVALWHTVMVQPASSSSRLIGRPTMLDAPTITAFLPRSSSLVARKSVMMPRGVDGRSVGIFTARRPML